MILRRSSFAHLIELAPGRALILHAVSQNRLAVDPEVARLFSFFEEPRTLPKDVVELASQMGYDPKTLAGCVVALLERGFLTEKPHHQEVAEIAKLLAESTGRDAGEKLDGYRKERREGGEAYWSTLATRNLTSLSKPRRRINVALLADCDLQREAEHLRIEGESRGLDLHISAAFPGDFQWLEEHSVDIILIGALRSRATIAAAARGEDPTQYYVSEARSLIAGARARSAAPILIDNLPEPTVEPLGFAEGGRKGHRNRYRAANLALAQAIESFDDVFMVDVAAALASAGSQRWLDDSLTSFTHFGSPGWLLLRPESEKQATHGLFPDPSPLLELIGGDPHGRERIVARVHSDYITAALAIDQIKCVIVDLDGVLWPGVLAETGSPFAWTPEVSSLSSYIGLYVGIHEALKMLQRRGIVLAAVSKNDESLLRQLWTYPEYYPRERLLTPEDFVTWRVNWRDKAENIREIAAELGFAEDAFLFIDDHPVERERVTTELPNVAVWGEDLFSLRRNLLTDARLQRTRLSSATADRTTLVKAQLAREKLRLTASNEKDFLDSLEIECEIERVESADVLNRVVELIQRTTQFNATGRKFSLPELKSILEAPKGFIFVMKVKDRLSDYGLVAAAIVLDGEILNFVMSCRVIGLSVERAFLEKLLSNLAPFHQLIVARFIETDRNSPARNLYRTGGFTLRPDGLWERQLASPADRDARDAKVIVA